MTLDKRLRLAAWSVGALAIVIVIALVVLAGFGVDSGIACAVLLPVAGAVVGYLLQRARRERVVTANLTASRAEGAISDE